MKTTNLIKKDGRDYTEEVYKKDFRRAFSANPEWQIFKIYTSVPTMMASQGDTEINKLLAHPKHFWIQHWILTLTDTKIKSTLSFLLYHYYCFGYFYYHHIFFFKK